MPFDIPVSLPALTVFLQGLLSFFSPCVFPLVPVYVSFFAGEAKTVTEDGKVRYPRRRVLLHTICFVLGISAAFFLLGFGFTALGRFFSAHRLLFARFSGVLMIFFGLYQLGLFDQSAFLERERRLPFRLDRFAMGPLPALALGFTFSFAWTPCVGPTLSGVLLLAGSAGSAAKGLGLTGLYTLGFVLPFLAVGLFTGTVLEFFGRHKNVVGYTVKIAALLLILMGVMTLTGLMSDLSGALSRLDGLFPERTEQAVESPGPAESLAPPVVEEEAPPEESAAPPEENEASAEESAAPQPAEDAAGESEAPGEEEETQPAPDFTLTDQYGEEHTLSGYQGKTVFLNFWATWCPPCRSEMPDIQKLYEEYGCNGEDLVVLGLAAPGLGSEGDREAVTAFLADNGYTFPVVMDEDGTVTWLYGIRAYPTTFMICPDGSVYGYVEGALTEEWMRSIVEQTMEAGAE